MMPLEWIKMKEKERDYAKNGMGYEKVFKKDKGVKG